MASWTGKRYTDTRDMRSQNLVNSPSLARLTHILAGEADHSASHVQGVLTPLQHAAKPIEGRILIGASHGLMQCWDTVEMLLAFGLRAKTRKLMWKKSQSDIPFFFGRHFIRHFKRAKQKQESNRRSEPYKVIIRGKMSSLPSHSSHWEAVLFHHTVNPNLSGQLMCYVKGQTELGYPWILWGGVVGWMAWLIDTVTRRKSKQTLFYMSELLKIT